MSEKYSTMMKNSPKYKWYKPLLAFAIGFVVYFVLALVVTIVPDIMAAAGISGDSGYQAADGSYVSVNLANPISVFFLMMGVAVMIPAVSVGMRVTKLGNLGTISSVEGHLRWDLIKKLVVPVTAVTAVLVIINVLIGMAVDGQLGQLAHPNFAPLGLLAILLFVPFQSAAEEYVFRGFALQAFGSWIPIVAIPIVLQAVLFGLSHGYNLVGNVEIMISGLIWGWLAVKTGGIEVTICLHAANNAIAMMLATIFAAANVSVDIAIWKFVLDVAFTLIVAVVAYYVCKRNGYVLSDK